MKKDILVERERLKRIERIQQDLEVFEVIVDYIKLMLCLAESDAEIFCDDSVQENLQYLIENGLKLSVKKNEIL